MKPIYKPKGRALEYSPDALALNIYTGCPHKCFYCFAPTVLKKNREEFHSNAEPRKGIVEAVKKQLEKGYVDYDNPLMTKGRLELKGRLIHLCFTCDPYPVDHDTSITREIIRLIKESGNHVQILTKGDETAQRDFDLLDENDWFGVTISALASYGTEFYAGDVLDRVSNIYKAKDRGLKTWISCEPVLNAENIHHLLSKSKLADSVDLFRIGKLNYFPSDINWGEFGRECERLCIEYGRNYYIKVDLRKEMDKQVGV